MQNSTFSRRHIIVGAATIALLSTTGALRAEQATAWGWPQPYEQVSEKSAAWLKEKGWWPLGVGYQPPWSGQNALNIVVDRLNLLQKRGVETTFVPFVAGPPLIEAFTAGRIQVGGSGNFPFHSLVDRKVPAKGVINYSLLTHAVVVPNDSPLKTLSDLKGAKEPHTIGIVTGSSSEFYFQAAAEANGIEIGKDVILRNLPLSEQLQLPRGVAAVVPWEFTVSLLTDERKTGRVIDTVYPYSIYEGLGFVRQELIESAPDIAQAIVDSFFEAALWIRLNPKEAAELLQQDPALKAVDRAFLAKQIEDTNNLFKPTALIPHPEFWAKEAERIRTWLKERNRLTRDITEAEYAAAYDAQFAINAARRLGWKVPEQPIFLPKDWSGKIGEVPYPDYFNRATAQAPQAFPEPGDLEKPWTFGGTTHQP